MTHKTSKNVRGRFFQNRVDPPPPLMCQLKERKNMETVQDIIEFFIQNWIIITGAAAGLTLGIVCAMWRWYTLNKLIKKAPEFIGTFMNEVDQHRGNK